MRRGPSLGLLVPSGSLVVLVVAAFAGATLSAVVGLAGGAFLLAIMYAVGLPFAVPIHAAVQLVSNTTRLLLLREHLDGRAFAIFALVAAPLPWLVGMPLVDRLDPTWVRAGFGWFVLYVTWMPKRGIDGLPRWAAFAIAGALGGSLGVVFGAVGPLLAPFFFAQIPAKERLVATQAACACWLHVLKLAAFSTWGGDFALVDHLGVIVPLGLATVAGTFLGRRLLGRVSERGFRRLFRTVLTVLAIHLMLTPWI